MISEWLFMRHSTAIEVSVGKITAGRNCQEKMPTKEKEKKRMRSLVCLTLSFAPPCRVSNRVTKTSVEGHNIAVGRTLQETEVQPLSRRTELMNSQQAICESTQSKSDQLRRKQEKESSDRA